MKSLLALTLSALISISAGSAFASETTAAGKPDLAKGEEKSTQVCAACHTADGSRGSPANPILQGQHADYLVKQLTEFKAGIRANAIMAGMAGLLSADDMKNVAAFYASKQAKPAANSKAHSQGVQIGGDASSTVHTAAAASGFLCGRNAKTTRAGNDARGHHVVQRGCTGS